MTYIDRDFEMTHEAKEWLQEKLVSEGELILEKSYAFTNADLGKSYKVQKLSLDANKQIVCEALDVDADRIRQFSISRMNSEQFLEMVDGL